MKMSYAQLKAYVANVVTVAKLSINSFAQTRDNSVLLLDKIGKIITLDTDYQTDKLNMFDGEYLSFGKSIEEWSADLIAVEDYDSSGSGALSPHRGTYRPVFYSYTVGRKKIPQTIDYNDLERTVHFSEQFVELIAMKYKRIEDSMAQYRYALKREMIAKLYAIASDDEFELSGADKHTWDVAESVGWATEVNDKADNGLFILTVDKTNLVDKTLAGVYLAVRAITATETKTLAQLIAGGYLVKMDLVTEIAKPVDTSTGEAFIEQIKKDVEVAQDSSEGHSLNGNSLGATQGLVLILRQGVMPNLEVNTFAGAFQEKNVAVPVEVVVVKDFGSASEDVFGLLIDRRGMRLHNTYNATRENLNGDGDFLNLFRHTEDTCYISRNCFFKFYKVPQA